MGLGIYVRVLLLGICGIVYWCCASKNIVFRSRSVWPSIRSYPGNSRSTKFSSILRDLCQRDNPRDIHPNMFRHCRQNRRWASIPALVQHICPTLVTHTHICPMATHQTGGDRRCETVDSNYAEDAQLWSIFFPGGPDEELSIPSRITILFTSMRFSWVILGHFRIIDDSCTMYVPCLLSRLTCSITRPTNLCFYSWFNRKYRRHWCLQYWFMDSRWNSLLRWIRRQTNIRPFPPRTQKYHKRTRDCRKSSRQMRLPPPFCGIHASITLWSLPAFISWMAHLADIKVGNISERHLVPLGNRGS